MRMDFITKLKILIISLAETRVFGENPVQGKPEFLYLKVPEGFGCILKLLNLIDLQ
jgi:hypothetical protein